MLEAFLKMDLFMSTHDLALRAVILSERYSGFFP